MVSGKYPGISGWFPDSFRVGIFLLFYNKRFFTLMNLPHVPILCFLCTYACQGKAAPVFGAVGSYPVRFRTQSKCVRFHCTYIVSFALIRIHMLHYCLVFCVHMFTQTL